MVRARRRPLVLLAACLGLAAVAGCAAATSTPPAGGVEPSASYVDSVSEVSPAARPSSPSVTPSPEGVNVAAFDALARQEATAWARSPLAKAYRTGLVLLDPVLTSAPSGGFPSAVDEHAFADGALVFAGSPPSGLPPGVVSWSNGATMKVPVLSAARAFDVLTRGGSCLSCVPARLTVTAARPATVAVQTSRGAASVPAWAFTIKGVSTPVIRVALAPGSYVTPNRDGAILPVKELGPLGTGFIATTNAHVSVTGRTLTLNLAIDYCDTKWGGLVYEVGGAVVIGGWRYGPQPQGSCAATILQRLAAVRLATPVGDQVILDAASGQPVTQEP